MYFPKLYPDELLYSGIARCRTHLGIRNHKTLLHMLFGDSRVAAITDLPSHLTALSGHTGLDTMNVIMRHTLFPLYAPFIPQKRRTDLFQAMLSTNRPTIGLAGVSTARIKWPEWLRYCPVCLEEMAANFGEPYWRRSWQIQGIDVCPEHGCQLLDSPIPFRRPQRHEFHPLSPLFVPNDIRLNPARESDIKLAQAATQLLLLDEEWSPGYERWTSFYRHLALECGARRGQQVKSEVIWEKIQASHRRKWLVSNGLLNEEEPPPWVLAMFRKHRKAFSALQHLIIWSSLRPDQSVADIISEANESQAELMVGRTEKFSSGAPGDRQHYRRIWLQRLSRYTSVKVARQQGGGACYAWLYRHDRAWLLATNRARQRRQGNNSCIDWKARDRRLVRLLITIGKNSEENLKMPRRSRSWFLQQLPHRVSVAHHLDQLPLCRAFLDRYAESVGEYQIRRLTAVMLDDVQAGIHSRRWELQRRCGLAENRMTPLARAFIQWIG